MVLEILQYELGCCPKIGTVRKLVLSLYLF